MRTLILILFLTSCSGADVMFEEKSTHCVPSSEPKCLCLEKDWYAKRRVLIDRCDILEKNGFKILQDGEATIFKFNPEYKLK